MLTQGSASQRRMGRAPASSIPLLACGLALAAGTASAFLAPAAPSSRGAVRMMADGGMALQTGANSIRPSQLDLSTMSYQLGVEALQQFQEKRRSIATGDQEHEPVESTMKRFNNLYGRPVIPFYRTTLYELVQTGHLAVTDASFMYTHFFAYGFLYAFESVFKGYPVPNEWVALFEAAAKSAKLDPDQIRKDAELLKTYMSSGKTQDDFLRAIESPAEGDKIEQEIAAIAKSTTFLPERYFSFGLCKTMEALGVEVNWDTIKTWCNKLSLDETRTQLDWDLLDRSTKKLSELELLMKQVEIREKKKLAERLEEKAKKAAELAAASLASSSSSSEPKDAEKAPAMAN